MILIRLQTDILYIVNRTYQKIMKLFVFIFLLATLSCNGQNTMPLEEGATSPIASPDQIAWMEGHWKGQAFGGITEEIWSPPLDESMMFSFKLAVEGKVNFYELGHVRQLGETLVFELKHFGNDLKGWEEKDEVQSFKLVKIDSDIVSFEGFTFEKVTTDEINIYALINENGIKEEMKFNYKRE
jgi:hypothetical protein